MMIDNRGRGGVHQKMMDDYDKGGFRGLRYTYFLLNMKGNTLLLCRNLKIEVI